MVLSLICIFALVALVERRQDAEASRKLREGLMIVTLAITAVLIILLVQGKIEFMTITRMVRWVVGPLIAARAFLFAQDQRSVRW